MEFVKKQIQNDLEYQKGELVKYEVKNDYSAVRWHKGRISGLEFALYVIELEEKKND